MFIIDFDDTLFNTHAFKSARVQASRDLDASEMKKLLFSDAVFFLHYLKTSKQKLILLSFGEFEFQNKKIDAAGIAGFFDEVIITPGDKESALEKILKQFHGEKEVWFINDKIEETKKIVQRFPQIKPLLKVSPKFPIEDYQKSGMPYFLSLVNIEHWISVNHFSPSPV